MAGDNNSLKARLDASTVKTANLLTVFEHEAGAPVDFNPSLMIAAENTASAPGIKTGKDYLFHTRKFLEQAQVKYAIDEVYTTSVGGREFAAMNVNTDYAGMNIKQVYYVAVKDGFSLTFITTYVTDQQQESLKEVIKTVQFN